MLHLYVLLCTGGSDDARAAGTQHGRYVSSDSVQDIFKLREDLRKEKEENQTRTKRKRQEAELIEYPVTKRLRDDGIITDATKRMTKAHLQEFFALNNINVAKTAKREDMIAVVLQKVQQEVQPSPSSSLNNITATVTEIEERAPEVSMSVEDSVLSPILNTSV